MNANNTFTGTNTFNSKLDTRAGIVGPVASLTYATDMIGYSFKSNGTGALQTMTSLTWYSIQSTGFTFPSPGVYIICLNFTITTDATAGNVLFTDGGLSNTAAVAPTGQGSFEIGIMKASFSKASGIAGYAGGSGTFCSTITSSATPYFINVRTQFGGPVITLNRTASTYQCTRIA